MCLILPLTSAAISGDANTDSGISIGGVGVSGSTGSPASLVTSPFIILPITTLLT